MSERYEVVALAEGDAIVMDRETGLPVKTGSGQIYTAPITNANWTALTLNRRMAETAASPILADAMMTPEEQVAILESEGREMNGLPIEEAAEHREAKEEERTPRHARPQSEWSLTWQVGAYKSGSRVAERLLREVAAMLEDNTSYALRSRVERALNHLEAGREVAEEQNPYA